MITLQNIDDIQWLIAVGNFHLYPLGKGIFPYCYTPEEDEYYVKFHNNLFYIYKNMIEEVIVETYDDAVEYIHRMLTTYSTEPDQIVVCPLCHDMVLLVSETPFECTVCRNGHMFFICPVHDRLVPGVPDTRWLFKCQCYEADRPKLHNGVYSWCDIEAYINVKYDIDIRQYKGNSTQDFWYVLCTYLRKKYYHKYIVHISFQKLYDTLIYIWEQEICQLCIDEFGKESLKMSIRW